MKIIIVGCGKVGLTLVERLSQEKHDLVVIDQSETAVEQIRAELDIMVVVGNGNSFQTLKEAGVAQADLLIAVTGSDEENLLCCMIAKKTGHCHTIARVRNPIYNREIPYLKKEFDLAMIVNTDSIGASEMARIFQFPSAIKISPFANGRIELLRFRISKDSPLKGDKVTNIKSKYNPNILVCAVNRDEQITIPKGDFVFEENDVVSIIGMRHDAIAFFRKLGLMTGRVKNVIIAGGGRISFYLAESLIKAGIHVTIIERDRERCEHLAEILPQATIICGDATDERLLEQEGLPDAEGFAALTGMDEENILLSLYSKQVSEAKVITKINRINFSNVISDLNLDSVMNPRFIMADRITRYVRSLNNTDNSNVENLYQLEDGKAEALEFVIKEKSNITDIPLQKLRIKKNTLICGIYRGGRIIIPSGQDTLQVNDSVVVVLSGYKISDLKDIIEA